MRLLSICVAMVTGGLVQAAEPVRTISVGEESPHVALVADGRTLAVGAGDSVRLFDLRTGNQATAFTDESWAIHSFASHGQLLATALSRRRDDKPEGCVSLWDTSTRQRRLRLDFWPESDVQTVAFSWDGKVLAAGGLRGIRVWDVGTGKLRKEIPMEAAVLVLAFSPDGKTLAAGAFTGFAHLWDTDSWKETTLRGHKTEVRAIAYTPDGRTLVTGDGSALIVWSAKGERQKTIEQPEAVWVVAFSPDGKTLAVGTGDPRADLRGAAALWNAQGWTEQRCWSQRRGMVRSLAFSPNGEQLAYGYLDGTIEIRNVADD
jgi:WD40 repeat protein